jgi:hypothetical protein
MQDMTQIPVQHTPPPERPTASPEELKRQRQISLALGGILLVFVVFTLVSVYFLLQPTTNTEKIRDVFIIFLALESMILMLIMVILIFQLSVLINLLQNEIKPILDSTNETVSTLRGTANFLSENLSEPVIKMNEYLAGFTQFFSLIRTTTKPRKTKNKINDQGE